MNLKDIKISFEHSAAEIELIIAGLRKLPMEMVQELHDKMINHANAKIAEQIQPAEIQPVETE